MIIDFNLEDILLGKNAYKSSKSFYEGIHNLDLSSFSENIDVEAYALKTRKVNLEAKVALYIDTYG